MLIGLLLELLIDSYDHHMPLFLLISITFYVLYDFRNLSSVHTRGNDAIMTKQLGAYAAHPRIVYFADRRHIYSFDHRHGNLIPSYNPETPVTSFTARGCHLAFCTWQDVSIMDIRYMRRPVQRWIHHRQGKHHVSCICHSD